MSFILVVTCAAKALSSLLGSLFLMTVVPHLTTPPQRDFPDHPIENSPLIPSLQPSLIPYPYV